VVQALAFAELLLGGLLLVSAIEKESLSELLTKGITAKAEAKGSAIRSAESQASAGSVTAGAAPPPSSIKAAALPGLTASQEYKLIHGSGGGSGVTPEQERERSQGE
jgi:hypothetical protein